MGVGATGDPGMPYTSNGELLKVADREKVKTEKCKDRPTKKRRRTAFT